MPWSVDDVAFVTAAVARTAVEREAEFSELDSVVGDGDFGFSLARGFEVVLAELDAYDRTTVSSFLRKVAMAISGHSGGTSGPLWGTFVLRAATAAGDRTELAAADVIAMLEAGALGIQQRGGAELGDKTLLDALLPAIESLKASVAEGPAERDHANDLGRAAATAVAAAEATRGLIAKRGRAAYTGERSIGSLDAGAVAVGVMFSAVHRAWASRDRKETA